GRGGEAHAATTTAAASSAGSVAATGATARSSAMVRIAGDGAVDGALISATGAPVCAPGAPAEARSAAAAISEATNGRTMADTVPRKRGICVAGSRNAANPIPCGAPYGGHER